MGDLRTLPHSHILAEATFRLTREGLVTRVSRLAGLARQNAWFGLRRAVRSRPAAVSREYRAGAKRSEDAVEGSSLAR